MPTDHVENDIATSPHFLRANSSRRKKDLATSHQLLWGQLRLSSTTLEQTHGIRKNVSPPLLKITQGLLSLLSLHSHSPGDEGEESQSIWQQRKRNIVNCWQDALDQRKTILVNNSCNDILSLEPSVDANWKTGQISEKTLLGYIIMVVVQR